MFRKTVLGFGLLVLLVLFSPNMRSRAGAQENLKPLDPNKARTNYSFPIKQGGRPFRFKIELDKTSIVTGVSVFRESESTPFQTLPACMANLPLELNENDEDLELLTHADLNFDGFEDLELLQYDNTHLDKKLYCIYLWDDKRGSFNYAAEITNEVGISPMPHPENRTITTVSDWLGGAHEDSTYRWIGDKLELFEQSGTYENIDNPKCHFTYSCSRLIKGKMVTTLEKPLCSENEIDSPPVCPANVTPPAPTAPPKSGKGKE